MQYVVMTGAYGGMGLATARLLAKCGFFVFALDKTVLGAEENIYPIQVDLTSVEDISRAVSIVREKTDEVFAIVHFAGIYALDSLIEMDEIAFRRIFEINLFGAFSINKAFAPFLQSGSRILITTSELAPLDPLPFTGVYAVSKAALDKYAYSLRMEMQLLGVQVSVLRAGAVSTGMLGVSTTALERFCENTNIYKCNAERFRRIVDSVEAKSVSTEAIAKKVVKILRKKRQKFDYTLNRNKLLLLLNALPKGMQCAIIRKILK